MDYLYTGNPGNYCGISVIPGKIYKFDKAPNPKLFKVEGKIEQKEEPEETEETIYSIIDGIKGFGDKLASEVAEEYSNLEDLKEDIENGAFSVGGVSERKIELIKKELNI